MRNRTYGGVRGRKTKVGRKLLCFPPTRLVSKKLVVLKKKDTIVFLKKQAHLPGDWYVAVAEQPCQGLVHWQGAFKCTK
jgi:hypothetical protein